MGVPNQVEGGMLARLLLGLLLVGLVFASCDSPFPLSVPSMEVSLSSSIASSIDQSESLCTELKLPSVYPTEFWAIYEANCTGLTSMVFTNPCEDSNEDL